MIGQIISKNELTLQSLSQIREGRCGIAGAFPSLRGRDGERGDDFDKENQR